MNTSPRSIRRAHVFAALAIAAIGFARTVHAGPPLICHPYAIGDARSLPMREARELDPNYERSRLVEDTMALLTPEVPVLVRMETLRRAAIYATGELRAWREGAYTTEDRALAHALIARLRERTQTAASDAARALALFDLGFFAETLRQTEMDPALEGYALLTKAAELRPDEPAIQFALALASVRPQRPQHATHLAQARAAARPDTLLAQNLDSHFGK